MKDYAQPQLAMPPAQRRRRFLLMMVAVLLLLLVASSIYYVCAVWMRAKNKAVATAIAAPVSAQQLQLGNKKSQANAEDMKNIKSIANNLLLENSKTKLAAKKTKVVEEASAPKVIQSAKLDFYHILLQQPVLSSASTSLPVKANNDASVKSGTVKSGAVKSGAVKSGVVNNSPIASTSATSKSALTYRIQLATFKEKSNMSRLVNKLNLAGFAVKVETLQRGQQHWYRLSLGPYSDQKQLQADLRQLTTWRLHPVVRKIS